jgi:hypothetical protein
MQVERVIVRMPCAGMARDTVFAVMHIARNGDAL